MYLKDIVANYLPNIKLNHDFLIIGVTGNVASGKSTFASYLKKELQKTFLFDQIETISTDDFLYTNDYLINHNLFNKKGWLESYDFNKITNFFNDLNQNEKAVLNGKYNQQIGDMNQTNYLIKKPTVLILEGTMVLTPLFEEYIDLSIFLEVDLETNYKWFKGRSLENLKYKKEYAHLSVDEASEVIETIWSDVNLKTFFNYIEPYKENATIKISVNEFHEIKKLAFQGN